MFDAGRSCAVGAGVEALGLPFNEMMTPREYLNAFHFADQAFPYLNTRVNCPVSPSEGRQSLLNMIWHLNDDHQWTREQIADWLESEEEKLGYVTLTESVEVRSESPELTEVTV
jgi:hypothetical protein